MDIMPSLTQAPVGLDEEEMGEGPELEIVIENPEDVEIGVDGLVIDLMPDDLEGVEFDGNLAEIMDENELASIGSDIIALVDADIQSRKEWVDMYVDGLDVLGMKYERRTEPWDDACGVYSTVLTEAAIRFQSETIIETFPSSGPVKTKIVGAIDRVKEEAAARVREPVWRRCPGKTADQLGPRPCAVLWQFRSAEQGSRLAGSEAGQILRSSSSGARHVTCRGICTPSCRPTTLAGKYRP